jgi:hypothetical protein
MQCHESFRGARLRRSNQKRGKQADEHGGNQRRMDEQWRMTQILGGLNRVGMEWSGL